jgi:hypothetical protein
MYPSMSRLALLLAPGHLALRRLRERPLATMATVLAVAGAGGLIGWSSIAAARAQERSVHLRLGELEPAKRAVRIAYSTLPLLPDSDEPTVRAELARLGSLAESRHVVRVWHPIAPADERGTRLVLSDRPREDVALTAGRLPAGGCSESGCEALSLVGGHELGRRIRLGPVVATVVGLGSLRSVALSDRAQLGARALLVGPPSPKLLRLLRHETGSTVVATAPLDPEHVHGSDLRPLAERLRRDVVRLDRSDPEGLLTATAPLGVLDRLADRGDVARTRLLLVASEGAALILAFAAFAAAARRRETRLVEEQLATLGASRVQIAAARATEALVPSLAGLALALVGLFAAGEGAFRTGTVLTIVVVTAVAALLLAEAGRPLPARRGVGSLELAALAALGVVVWQTAATGALDPGQIAAGDRASPVLLLVPALAFFATAVLLLRVLPWGLRLAERAARRAPFGTRLALLGAARRPGQAAAATTFLAVALGASLFSLDYRATLDRHARDEADFALGAPWRASGGNVAPLTRLAHADPTPGLRFGGTVEQALASSEALPVQVVAVPAARLEDLRGWRRGFSRLSRAELAHKLRPRPVRLRGPTIAADATALRVWARADTDRERIVVLHLLLPGQTFAHVPVGSAWKSWRRLELPVPRRLRGAQLVGIEFLPTFIEPGREPDVSGTVDLGRFEVRRAGGWSPLPPLSSWTAAESDTGQGGYLVVDAPFTVGSPEEQGLELDLNGTLTPLIRPSLGLPAALPALVGGTVAQQAVDGKLTVDLAGRPLSVRVAASASRFPTVVRNPDGFVVLDYDTLFAALNVDRPGSAVPTDAWFFRPQRPTVHLEHLRGADELRARLLHDPLAGGTRDVLGITALVAAALAALGLLVGVRATLDSERLQAAEYEALGVAPSLLARSVQLRLLVLSALGIGAGFAGGVLAVRLIGAFVAVTGTAVSPIPSIVPIVAWIPAAVIIAALGAVALASARLVARRALRGPAARRLTA